ncbi:MAG: xanthine dehydrogenase family protein molybdopterin-binding subunit, partial [Bradyrhizobiaceae bacterium]|nr:xanthine dehydrogenase family protein molybdopterin-binding subunit [Bradyrhizobiaceae bacterium]
MKGVNSYVGRPMERIEDLRFLRGGGTYVADLNRPGQLHAVIVRSSVPHGRIRSIDASRAVAMPGIHRVLTAADFAVPIPRIALRLQPLPQLEPFLQPMIAFDKVRYVGEPVAMVVA